MKRQMTLLLLLTLGLLLSFADSAVTARPNITVPAAPESEFIVCSPFQGQPADILYYLLPNQPTPFSVRHTYIDTGTTAGIIFDDGTGPYKRVVHEFRSPVVRAVCEADRAQFEVQFGIQVGPQIQGELYQIRHAGTGARVGTVFIDSGTTGDRATGGGLTVQETYACNQGGQPKPVLQKTALFHSAFDVGGIDGAMPATIERQYLGPARSLLANRARRHLVQQGCVEISYDAFAALVQSGLDCELHFDNGDPGPGVYRQQSN